MLTIPSTVQALFKNDSVRKNFRVTFPNGEMSDITNDNIVQESVKFTESLCSQSVFKFGLAEASVLEFETVGIANMYGMTIEAGIEIDISSLSAAQITAIESGTWDGTLVKQADSDLGYGYFHVSYGVFKVVTCPRDHQAMAHRKVTALSDSVMSNQLNLPERLVWPKVITQSSALLAAASGSGLVLDSTATPVAFAGENLREINMYDSNGDAHTVKLHDLDNSEAPMMYGDFLMSNMSSATERTSFVSVEMPDYDPDAYEQMGIDVAQAITDAGYDWTYDIAGNQRFSSNEEALRYCAPWLFAPCIVYDLYDTSNSRWETMCVQTVTPDTLIPVVSSKKTLNNLSKNSGFYVDDTSTDYQLWVGSSSSGTPASGLRGCTFFAVQKTASGTNVRITFDIKNVYLDLTLEGYLTSSPSVKRYTLSSYDSYELQINNTGSSSYYYDTTQGTGTSAVIKNTGYLFHLSNEDVINLLTGAAEVNAMFVKTDRGGGFEAVRLDDSSPISIIPGNYSEVWWDEYTVDPIGTVSVSYTEVNSNNETVENTTDIVLGGGQSVYNMTNNAALKAMVYSNLWTVKYFLNTHFKPYMSKCQFTPSDIKMQGWPWIEAGDALQITAEDGTIVNTYALRIELSGIQQIQASITADGGVVIKEVT